MKREYNRRVYGDIGREAEESSGHYFAADAGHGYSSDINPPRFGHYPASWTTLGPHAGRGPRSYRRSDDRIAEDVNERLTHHGHIDATEIEIKVDQGEVTLEGTVDSRKTRRMAEEVAESVSGVVDIINRLHVGESIQSQSERRGQTRTHEEKVSHVTAKSAKA